jgi:hypothetical protein
MHTDHGKTLSLLEAWLGDTSIRIGFLPCRMAMAFACQPPCPVKLTELPA